MRRSQLTVGAGSVALRSCSWRARPTLLFLLATLAAAAALPGARSHGLPAPIGSSVILLFLSDVDGGTASPCAQMARRAAATGGAAINFVVTG